MIWASAQFEPEIGRSETRFKFIKFGLWTLWKKYWKNNPPALLGEINIYDFSQIRKNIV